MRAIMIVKKDNNCWVLDDPMQEQPL
jgi:hypothetical protein